MASRLFKSSPDTQGARPVPEDHVNDFSQFGLTAAILRSLDDLGFEEPTPVQARALPILLAGRDMVAQALTGHR